MSRIFVVAAALAIPAAPTAAQAVWDAHELGAGRWQFRLGNDAGAAIVLVCEIDGVRASLEFPDALDATESGSIRGVPGGRQNIAVAPMNDRAVRLTTTRGLEVLLRALRNTATVNVHVGGAGASFAVFGSAPVVSECLQRQRPDTGS